MPAAVSCRCAGLRGWTVPGPRNPSSLTFTLGEAGDWRVTGQWPGTRGSVDGPMGISDFARLSRLSPRALRLYDEPGLLPPASVDPDSGYRWYSAGQLAPARLIAALRGIGMPLAQISTAAGAERAAAAGLVSAFWPATEREHSGRRQLAAYLVDQLDIVDTLAHSTYFDEFVLLSVVTAAEVPVPMAAAAQRIRTHLGNDVLTSGWAGAGSFRKFVESLTGDSLQISGPREPRDAARRGWSRRALARRRVLPVVVASPSGCERAEGIEPS